MHLLLAHLADSQNSLQLLVGCAQNQRERLADKLHLTDCYKDLTNFEFRKIKREDTCTYNGFVGLPSSR